MAVMKPNAVQRETEFAVDFLSADAMDSEGVAVRPGVQKTRVQRRRGADAAERRFRYALRMRYRRAVQAEMDRLVRTGEIRKVGPRLYQSAPVRVPAYLAAAYGALKRVSAATGWASAAATAAEAGASSRVITDRLRSLQRAGLVEVWEGAYPPLRIPFFRLTEPDRPWVKR